MPNYSYTAEVKSPSFKGCTVKMDGIINSTSRQQAKREVSTLMEAKLKAGESVKITITP